MLKLDENNILKNKHSLRGGMAALIEEYLDVFSEPNTMNGHTDLMEFDIELELDAKPLKAWCKPLNLKQKESLHKKLETLKWENMIEESNSPWTAALVPCLMKDGKTSWEVDYHPLNLMTIADNYPLPWIKDTPERL